MPAYKNIIIRKGLPEDAEDFSNFVMIGSRYLFPGIYGSKARSTLQNLFRRRKNLFSFEHSYFAEVDGVRVGMITGYDWKTERREKLRTGLLLVVHMRRKLFTKIRLLPKVTSVIGKAGDGEYYINGFAVYSEFRGAGLGTKLLSKVEEEAKSRGAKKIALDTGEDNVGAIRLYSRVGYSIVGRVRRGKVNGREIVPLRMCKRL